LSAVHVHLRTAAALQDCEGPGGSEEPDTSDAVAIEFQNNTIVEENNFTDLGKQKKPGKTADMLRKYIENLQSCLARTYRIPINAYCYPPDVIIT